MEVVAFVGPAGTGKSYRAHRVAKDVNADVIIDDGLLIKGSKVWAGNSAKSEKNKIQAVKRAIFMDPNHAKIIKDAFQEVKPHKVLILGTSQAMVKKIALRLDLPEPSQYVYIEDVSTEREIAKAKDSRYREGKHIVPVPTVELKPHYSGYLIDPFRGFFSKNKPEHEYANKSIVRPTFSMYGKMLIADSAIIDIVKLSVADVKEIKRITQINVKMVENKGKSVNISIDLVLLYGTIIRDVMRLVQMLVKQQVEFMTAMSVLAVNVSVRSLSLK